MNSVTKLIGLVLLCLGSAVFAAPAYQPVEYYDERYCKLKSHMTYDYWSPTPYIGIPYGKKTKPLLLLDHFISRFETSLGGRTRNSDFTFVKYSMGWAVNFDELNSRLTLDRGYATIDGLQYFMYDTFENNNHHRTHTLTDEDRMVILELIDIFVQDKQKSNELLDELYKRYLGQVELIVDGQIIVFLEYDGKYFSLKGYNVNYHPIKRCNYQYLYGLSIE